ncbi:MAG: hypothetical protein FI707_06855 [SAR202 cluster bacterium]|jgi:hypothetical protein|nr:hypothetical protein [SAR202 cluster bacterium]MQG58303.1 hypothetical protein [SAR202 cluster bacterium]MQG68494.1 hypothetical protein [SAR202 cluster bacterium]HAL48363.1 hypothetical protein [Dehalococcoidia bacterium]|tara:strand:+ start:2431 stop:2679 length:249 start_codon:yes stop_codon:yes gene_type:complete
MDSGFLIQMALAVVGAALIAGGAVLYRGSSGSGARSIGAAGVAAGAAMWALVALTTPISSTGGGTSPDLAVVTAPTVVANDW